MISNVRSPLTVQSKPWLKKVSRVTASETGNTERVTGKGDEETFWVEVRFYRRLDDADVHIYQNLYNIH